MIKNREEGEAHAKALVEFVESQNFVMKSRDIHEALKNVQKMGNTQRVNHKNRLSAHFFFIDGMTMKCSLPGCQGLKNPLEYRKEAFLNHLNRKHGKNHFSEYYMITFVMEDRKLRVMDATQLKKWFEDETNRQKTVIETKSWIEKVYSEWSQKVPDATEDQNFKFCSDANEFKRKFEASNQEFNWTAIFIVNNSSGIGSYPDKDTLLRVMREKAPAEKVPYHDLHQELFLKTSLKEFLDLFQTKAVYRLTVYNLLSFETSHIPELKELIDIPQFAKDRTMFNGLVLQNDNYNYDRYVIMSQAGAFTNFHIDFGGTSTYFYQLTGTKIFYFVEPTDANIAALGLYIRTNKFDGGPGWFGNIPGINVKKAALTAGNTLFMAAGWIHAVYTVTDSIAISGSIFDRSRIEMNLKIRKYEKEARMRKDRTVVQFVKYHYEYLIQKLLPEVGDHNIRKVAMVTTEEQKLVWKTFNQILDLMVEEHRKKKPADQAANSVKLCEEARNRQKKIQNGSV
ncbi:hypothetical protein CAEBREN_12105 [Caenorhabditis brenneri]|uniref:JmjC domain-containing protein n=1 Tax=Caenorhabditis brenneri TaxID=135651 RepID=G0MQS2_CAEBE|nr:hypothetical protein CAEBREN_12105 [Caenorhabditis brenneri]